MKTLINLILLALLSGTINAQSTPTPPTPPSPGTSTQVNNESNYRITLNSSDSETGEKIYLSLKNTDDRYLADGNFPNRFRGDIFEYLVDEMGTKNLTHTNKYDQWIGGGEDDAVYKITLKKRSLIMSLDKEIASYELTEKFGEIGMTIKELLSEKDEKEKVEELEREADHLRNHAKRLQQEAARLLRQAEHQEKIIERNNGRELAQTERDAARIAREAERLTKKLIEAERVTAYNGGMDSAIREVLGKKSTYYDANTAQNKNGWIWPAFQQDLILSLEGDELIGEDNELVVVYDTTGIYVNGTKLNTTLQHSYKDLFKRHGIGGTNYFKFYKLYDHIAVINSDAEILEFFDSLKEIGEISSVKMPVKLVINGDNVEKDGTLLSQEKLNVYNKLLTKHNIIPVPGKTIALLKKGNYKLGYSLGERTHIGTWGMNN